MASISHSTTQTGTKELATRTSFDTGHSGQSRLFQPELTIPSDPVLSAYGSSSSQMHLHGKETMNRSIGVKEEIKKSSYHEFKNQRNTYRFEKKEKTCK
uniref:Uncharacterized protein n=1 Tax=Arundo donax TaxID=35708 RepID=A0A0A8Z9N0_ARUDO